MAGLENPIMLALAVLILPTIYAAFRKSEKYNKIIALSRALIILLLVGAAAQPHIQSEQKISEETEVVVLQDESNSASLLERQELDFENVKVTERTIASGNSSDLRNAFLRNLQPNKNYLVVSDFQSSSSLDGVAERFRKQNSTLNALKYETEEDASVSISGPETTVPGAESRFLINVHSTGENIEPSVAVDGETAQPLRVDNDTWEITRTFSDKGSYRIKASIQGGDRFENNNNYYHAVDVTEKPKILVIGEEGALGEKLSKFYDITYKESVPEDLSPYYSVITTKDVNDNSLTSYVIEGNGLIHTGEPQDDSLDVLPVKKVPQEQLTDAAQIVLAIDISLKGGGKCVKYDGGSCVERSGAEGSVAKSKAVAYNIVEKLPFNNEIGVVAYNDEAYRVSNVVPLSQNRETLKRKISRLTTSGPALHQYGLNGSRRLLGNKSGNIILISDGYIPERKENDGPQSFSRRIPRETEQITSQMKDKRVYTIGVGDNPNRKYLEGISDKTNGIYYNAENAGRLKFEFTAGGAQGKTTPLVITQPDEFITRNMELRTSVENFDTVKPKAGADRLVAGTNGNTFLTTWRYGIGRVAAFSGDTEQLENTIRSDPLLVSRTVAWSVGDPKRKLDRWVRIENSRQPERIEIRSSYEIEEFKRQSENVYVRSFRPNSTGFGEIDGKYYGYNYNEEYQEIGYSEKMEDVVRGTGGNVYIPDEKQELVEDIKNFNEKKIVQRQELGSYLIALALLIFLAEVGYRKVNGKK